MCIAGKKKIPTRKVEPRSYIELGLAGVGGKTTVLAALNPAYELRPAAVSLPRSKDELRHRISPWLGLKRDGSKPNADTVPAV